MKQLFNLGPCLLPVCSLPWPLPSVCSPPWLLASCLPFTLVHVLYLVFYGVIQTMLLAWEKKKKTTDQKSDWCGKKEEKWNNCVKVFCYRNFIHHLLSCFYVLKLYFVDIFLTQQAKDDYLHFMNKGPWGGGGGSHLTNKTQQRSMINVYWTESSLSNAMSKRLF